MNTLYYGDNLDVLGRHVADESVDLVYLDPPFNSNANYNVLFAEKDGSRAAGQIQAFTDTWTWNEESERTYATLAMRADRVADCVTAFRTFLGPCDMLAYLVMMAPRLLELRRVMKPTASIYLHCDPTASHYLKMLMDAVFGGGVCLNEIIWQRSTAKGHAYTRYPGAHDTILFYGKSESHTWNRQNIPHREEYLKSHYGSVEDGTGRRYTLGDCLNPNPDRPNLTYEWHGHLRVWRWTREKMETLHADGRLVYTKSGMPRYKRYLDEMAGTPVTTVWTDIPPINSQAQERLGYPTQKPVALLERIIRASSNPGDVVLDPFCGCGTSIDAAQALGRQWIGIDITHLAINLMKRRLRDRYELEPSTAKKEGGYRVIGEPVSVPDAEALAASDPYQFQWWALGLVGARPAEQKKGADKGIDGKIVFQGDATETFETIILSVKAGHTQRAHVHELRGVVERERAAIGVLITMQEPTGPMREDAVTAGFWHSHLWNRDYAKIQLLTVAELLAGGNVDMPPQKQVNQTYKKAAKAKPQASHSQPDLFDQAVAEG